MAYRQTRLIYILVYLSCASFHESSGGETRSPLRQKPPGPSSIAGDGAAGKPVNSRHPAGLHQAAVSAGITPPSASIPLMSEASFRKHWRIER